MNEWSAEVIKQADLGKVNVKRDGATEAAGPQKGTHLEFYAGWIE